MRVAYAHDMLARPRAGNAQGDLDIGGRAPAEINDRSGASVKCMVAQDQTMLARTGA
eukprot:CAMPEP_0204116582 /NCGR_PEP_ID=MMETSP0361-20130328/5496_1 /ASSEMBLY_ACC=CAM_ASM_000343 /TAXON_ID=268821 /ORGANISM="Scrippsiella Hangoei, Strain SHTV-5" /LENGTH=56 /DNA_ID=CAMNT_0051067403 /DNA_START=593 /DNA_END=763 /DNA_ORIENTATION=+